MRRLGLVGGAITVLISVACSTTSNPGCGALDAENRIVTIDWVTGDVLDQRVVDDWPAWGPFVIRDGEPAVVGLDTGIDEGSVTPDRGPFVVDGENRVGFRSPDLEWTVEIETDETFSTVERVGEGDDEVLVLVASDLGPNRRLVVLERSDGSLRWMLDGVREAAAAARGGIIFDRRVPTDLNDDLTREVVVVDDQDPSAVRWTQRSAGSLGGHVGWVGDEDVFVTHPLHGPSAAYPSVQPGLPEFVRVSAGGTEGPLRAASDVLSAQGDGRIAVILEQQLLLVDADGQGGVGLSGDPVWHVAGTDEAVFVAVGLEPVGCD